MTIESFEEAQREFIHKRNLLLEYLSDAKKSTAPFEFSLEIEKLEDPCDIKTCLSVMLGLKHWGYDCIRNGAELFDIQHNLNELDIVNKHNRDCYTNDSVACKTLSCILDVCLEVIRRAAIAKKFEIYGNWCGDGTLVSPFDFFAWAQSKGYDLPHVIYTWLAMRPMSENNINIECLPDNPHDFGKLLCTKGYQPHECIKKIVEQFPKLSTHEIGAYARGIVPTEHNADSCKRWYQRRKPK